MKIFISEELIHIKEELKKRGYDIIKETENIACDTIICDLKNGGLVNSNMHSNIKVEGTLIIDSGSKSIEEIEYILNNRSYSRLF
jgi:broad-specificity NMP kinase